MLENVAGLDLISRQNAGSCLMGTIQKKAERGGFAVGPVDQLGVEELHGERREQ